VPACLMHATSSGHNGVAPGSPAARESAADSDAHGDSTAGPPPDKVVFAQATALVGRHSAVVFEHVRKVVVSTSDA